MKLFAPFFVSLFLLTFVTEPLRAESQGSEYKGVTDPFGDPTAYEFAEDEKADKEFFHLGRYLMFGLDFGMGLFTGGLGKTNSPSFYFGGHLVYFFDKSLAFEGAFHYVKHTDTIEPTLGNKSVLETTLMPITAGFRFYFDIKNAPRAIALANPYLAAGGGMYVRDMEPVEGVSEPVSDKNMGFYVGGGGEFLIYRRNIYLGADLRYHAVFFGDEDSTLGNVVQPGERSGDYFTLVMSLTYSF